MLIAINLTTNVQNVDLSSVTNKHAWLLKDLNQVKSKNVKVMSTFSCGGGSSLGYKLAGCDVIAANDIDPQMADHYRLNLNPRYYFLCPIKDLIKKDLPDELMNLDILDGSPPCSTFSMAGSREDAWGKSKHFREGQAKQVLSDLFFDYLDLVNFLKPKVAIAENVKGMILGNAKGYTKLVIEKFREIGYRPQLFLINAADCGVPQRRERVFFCAVRNDISNKALTIAPKANWVSFFNATKDIQNLTEEEIIETKPTGIDKKAWHMTEPGGCYADYFKKYENRNNAFSHQKMHKDRPACTLTATFDNFTHHSECRKLTFREWKRLGSFPDDYLAKSPNIGKYMIGMSVPPKMTAVVAEAVISQWLEK